MSIDRSRRDPEGATGLAAIEMAVVALLVVAVAATGLLAPRLVRALGDHAALRDRHAAALERLDEARAETDPEATPPTPLAAARPTVALTLRTGEWGSEPPAVRQPPVAYQRTVAPWIDRQRLN